MYLSVVKGVQVFCCLCAVFILLTAVCVRVLEGAYIIFVVLLVCVCDSCCFLCEYAIVVDVLCRVCFCWPWGFLCVCVLIVPL